MPIKNIKTNNTMPQMIPKRTVVTGICPPHRLKPLKNFLTVDDETGVIGFTSECTSCPACHPEIRRGYFSEQPTIDHTRCCPDTDDDMKINNYLDHIKDNIKEHDPNMLPILKINKIENNNECQTVVKKVYPTWGTTPCSASRCESCRKDMSTTSSNRNTCDECSTCSLCGECEKPVMDKRCRMCSYYQSLHDQNTPHKFPKCSLCKVAAVPVPETPVVAAETPAATPLDATAPVFVPAQPIRSRGYILGRFF